MTRKKMKYGRAEVSTAGQGSMAGKQDRTAGFVIRTR
jgi:hypothetical protein